MSRVTFNRKRVKLKKLLGIRARLALLALMLVAPLMLERVRSLDETRTKQVAQASEEYAGIAQHSADTQREIISSVETMLKSAAYIRASSGIGRSCEILRASLPTNLPWIRSIMIVSRDGLVQCSTLNMQVGLNIGDREYFRKAQDTHGFVFSDYLFGKTNGRPMMMAAYPVSAINPEEDAVVVAGINIDWLSKIMTNLGGRPGISSVLVDRAGVVIAAPADQTSLIGRPLDSVPLMAAVAEKALSSEAPTGSLSFTASALMPSVGCAIFPSRMSTSITERTSLTGMAKPKPLALSDSDLLAVLMPITSEFMLTSGPPELPWLIDASV